MDLRAMLTEEGAMSSVLGVVLMIAVTIILAAVVGTFVLGIGEELTQESPQVNFDHSFTEDSVTILHAGGDQIERDNVEVTIGGDQAETDFDTDGWEGQFITAGDTLRVEENGSGEIKSGESVLIVWSDGQQSAILSEERIP